LRAGYIHDGSVVPSSTLTPFIPGVLEHTFTAGYGKAWENWKLDLAYQYSFGHEQRVARSELVGGDFSGSELQARVHWLMMSLQYRF
jgi:hypothetical protein